jgi:hypothetical protein
MTDIVERLRAPVTVERHDGLLIEAADEIERLWAEVKTLRNKVASLRGMIEDEEEAER